MMLNISYSFFLLLYFKSYLIFVKQKLLQTEVSWIQKLVYLITNLHISKYKTWTFKCYWPHSHSYKQHSFSVQQYKFEAHLFYTHKDSWIFITMSYCFFQAYRVFHIQKQFIDSITELRKSIVMNTTQTKTGMGWRGEYCTMFPIGINHP